MTTSPARPNRARTVVLWGLLVVWLVEGMLSSVRPLTEWWTQFWEYLAPDDARLYLMHGILAAAKGTLAVLAVFALRSRRPFARSALYVPMALVPPLNIVFPFRAQGFLLRPTLIGATLSVIVWQTFFMFKEGAEPSSRALSTAGRSRVSPRDLLQYFWFAANATALTLAAALFLFSPGAGVRLAFPCLSQSSGTVPSGVVLLGMVAGTHLTAVAAATWLGTFYARSNGTIRQAVAAANTLHAGLLCVLPLLQLAREGGRVCASSSLLMYSIPLFAGWLVYVTLSHRSPQPELLLLS